MEYKVNEKNTNDIENDIIALKEQVIRLVETIKNIHNPDIYDELCDIIYNLEH